VETAEDWFGDDPGENLASGSSSKMSLATVREVRISSYAYLFPW